MATNDIREYVETLAREAREAAPRVAAVPAADRGKALLAFADRLAGSTKALLKANAGDLKAASKAGENEAFLDRLAWDDRRISGMANGVREVAALPDPIGEVIEAWTRPNGIRIELNYRGE